MLLIDVNVLLYAHRRDAPQHKGFKSWLESLLAGDEPVGLADRVLSEFLRMATHLRIFAPPSPLQDALKFIEQIRTHPNAIRVEPSKRHWRIFARLCQQAGTKGNHIHDAYLAALALDSGGEFITTDRDFARFSGLNWRHPLGGHEW